MRRLKLEILGMWYTALTIALGVVALSTGNNALYLLEALLLSGMIFSGILSERAITGVHVRRVLGPAIAGEASQDILVLENLRSAPLFSIDILLYEGNRFWRLAFVPKIPGRAGFRGHPPLMIKSQEAFESRGNQSWHGIAIATSGPFGFARKTLLMSQPGSRWIWPRRRVRDHVHAEGLALERNAARSLSIPQMVEGEIRKLAPGEDSRWVIWSRSQSLEVGEPPYTRVLRPERLAPWVQLDLRDAERVSPQSWESRIEAAASSFYQDAEPGELRIVHAPNHQPPLERHRGRTPVLTRLAQLPQKRDK